MEEMQLERMLAMPSDALVEDMARLDGDLLILGAGGKMGPSLALLAAQALRRAGNSARVTAVSRYTDQAALRTVADGGVTPIAADLLEPGVLSSLPDARYILYMAGRKFGTSGSEELTWVMNAKLPAYVCDRFKGANIVAFSTGNIYPLVSVHSGGATEDTPPAPVGDYAMSCLGRERMFQHAAKEHGTRVLLYRLSYAIDFRYGVLQDIAQRIVHGQPISLSTGCFNCIWQGSANEIALRSLLHCQSPAAALNVTGPETVGVRYAAARLGKLLGAEPVFEGEESGSALLSNAGRAIKLFGYPQMGVDEMIERQADWLLSGGRTLGKPTKFEERGGSY